MTWDIRATLVVANTLFNAVVVSIFAYAVFGLGRSPWWLLVALLFIGTCHQRLKEPGE